MSMPTQTYTLAYFRRHVRHLFQAGDRSSMANGCIVMSPDHKPFLVFTPHSPVTKQKAVVRKVVSLQKLLENFDDLDTLMSDSSPRSVLLVVTHHDVARYDAVLHPDYKRPVKGQPANDDVRPQWSTEHHDKLLDAANSAVRINDLLEDAVAFDRKGEYAAACDVLAAARKRLEGITRAIDAVATATTEVSGA